jgi:subtilisin family serine protease
MLVRRAYSTRTICIGVVDSGVDCGHPLFQRKKPRGIGVRRDGDEYHYEPDYYDFHGHGTAVASRIQSFCPKARICAVRVTRQDETEVAAVAEEQSLAMGIEWCVDQGIRIVNVSYSMDEAPTDGFLARACRRAHEGHVIIVAAYRRQENGPVYPAAYRSVIGVRRRPNLQPGQVSVLSANNHDLWAYGRSNSIACAQVSAMVGRIHTVDDRYGLEEVFELLMEVAVP